LLLQRPHVWMIVKPIFEVVIRIEILQHGRRLVTA
jgi:hypothetical protein